MKRLEELSQMGWDPALFHHSADNSVRGPCPACGGHRRFVIYLNGAWPEWFARCDMCGFEGWAYNINPALRTPEIAANPPVLNKKPVDQVKRDQILATLPALIKSFQLQMSDKHREWWKKQGIDEDHQLVWELGHVSNRGIMDEDGGLHKVEAFVIPKFDFGWKPTNIDFRLIGAPESCGRYRPMAGLAPAAFLNLPNRSDLTDTVWVAEGSKKAMVLSIYLGDEDVVFGVPSNRSWCGLADRLHGVGRVNVLLDPDSWTPAHKLCHMIGPNARQITFPSKVDDAILGGMPRAVFDRLVAMAR